MRPSCAGSVARSSRRRQAYAHWHSGGDDEEEEQAEAAIKQLRGYNLYGKHLRLSYSRNTSDVIAKMRGTFDEGVKAKRLEEQKKSLRNKELK